MFDCSMVCCNLTLGNSEVAMSTTRQILLKATSNSILRAGSSVTHYETHIWGRLQCNSLGGLAIVKRT